MKPAGEPLKQLLSRLRLDEPLMGWKAVTLWRELAGEKVADHTRAVRFQRGTLVVEVDHPSWMNELSYLKHRMIDEINKHLGKPVVKAIQFKPKAGSSGSGASPSKKEHS